MMRTTEFKAVLILLLMSMSIVAFILLPTPSVKGILTADEHTLALWHFNEGEGQIVYDESIHGNDGTLGPTLGVEARDPSWTVGRTSQPGDYALDFVDWYDYVNVPDNPDDSLDLLCGDEFTIEFWTYVRHISRPDRGNGNHWNIWISKRTYHYEPGYVITQALRFGDSYLQAFFYDGTFHTVSAQPTPTHQWVHVMFTYDGQFLKLYVDGELQGINEIGHHYVVDNAQSLSIGKALGSDVPWSDAIDGVIDEVRISSIARKPVPPVEDTDAYIGYVNETTQGLPDVVFSKPGEDVQDIKDDFSDLFTDTLENINEGIYEGAIEKLNGIKERTYEDIVESTERDELISLIDDLIAHLETLL
ncbi:MAG: LamG domain-containing protein [Candidatus Bathyarchaeota archaeon]|nr:MAG: LamG domain-containing protein [Candidatus Bathyarchaeota archaeon]